MAGAFLTQNAIKSTSVLSTYGAVAPSMPLANLMDAQPRVRCRWNGNYATILVDLLASTAIDVVAILSTTLTTSGAANYRIRLSTADATGAAGNAWDVNGLVATGPDSQGNVVIVRSAPATGRYLLVEAFDGTLSQLDIGKVVAGQLWRPTYGMDYGATEGRMILDRRDRNPLTGAEFAVPAVANPRTIGFTLSALLQADAMGSHRQLLAQLGGAGDALWIPELTDTQAEINARAIWGSVNPPNDRAVLARTNWAWSARSFQMTERL